MTPTHQQQACIDAAVNNDFLKIDAVAGSGKTATLVMIADVIRTTSLYCAFNKVTALEASTKFGNHVVCQTTHSMAFAKFGDKIRHKLIRPVGGYVNVAGTSGEIGKYYKIDCVPFSKAQMGLFVKKTVARFEQSSDDNISMKHVVKYDIDQAISVFVATNKKNDKNYDPSMATSELTPELSVMVDDLSTKTQNIVFAAATSLWLDRINANSKVLATHDTYLKLFQLSKPKLGFSVIYLDEAADTTPCVLDIVLNQRSTSKIILVGDDRQAIYQWRGAVNAMNTIAGLTLPLSQSFRYGPEVASAAMAVLLGSTTVLGSDHIPSKIGTNVIDRKKPYTRIFRTNSCLLSEAVLSLSKGEKISIEIDAKDFIKVLQSAMALHDINIAGVKHDRIMPYSSWPELVDESKYDAELGRIVKIIKDKKADHIINTLTNYKPVTNPHIIMTTAHKSKGREWQQVKLESDFLGYVKYTDSVGTWTGLSLPDQNLLYVAVTRAISVLDINLPVEEALNNADGGYSDPQHKIKKY